ncbi:uncharacterized protein [Zea mays]|uniref:Binding n=1 Tax=Zea mays TaxID=4577 RepID=A0A1D6K6V7_MAIZE|nr:uncharacterized protein LOC103637093 isoform X1 [Zea mays]ONL99295.1 binding [Zea mays]|eukprot:XP_008657583.1 uncharacterized protein LOC103637093 isoform X1 [Zea mays]
MPGAMEPAEADAAAAAVAGRRPTASERRRMYRDLALSLRCGLRDAAAGFSFLRLRGLRALLRALRSTSDADADADAGLFRDSQSIRDLQVIPVLFEHSLRKATGDAVLTVAQVLGMEPAAARLRNPATDSEVVLALRVLEGCCLLCPACAAAAHRYNAVKVVLNILMTRGILEQRACLDTLLALLVNCSGNLTDFKEQDGLNKIAVIVKDANRDDHVRLKCSEFLLLYSGNAKEKCGADSESNMREDLAKVFGEKCASFISSMNLFSSTLESQMRQSELSFLAEHVLDYM